MSEKDQQVLVAEGYQRREDESEASVQPNTLPAGVSDTTAFMQVISRAAADPRMDPERLKLLYGMRNEELARIARQQFVAAMAKFKKNPPKIVKDKHVFFAAKNGGASTDYWHATLGNVVGSCIDGLAEVGISHKWTVRYEGRDIFVACVLTHEGGHEEVTNFPPLQPDNSGNKNPIQMIQSSITYAQRHTFLAAIGLAVSGQDDDGGASGARGGQPSGDEELVSEDQAANIQAVMTEVGANKVSFLSYLGVQSELIADIPASKYKRALALLEEKRNAPQKPRGAQRK